MSRIFVFSVVTLKYWPGQVVRRLAPPDVEHHVDRLEEDGVPVLLVVAEDLRVRHQPARADAHDEAPFQHVIEHRHLRRDRGRVGVRHVDRAAAEHDALRVVGEAGEEHQARGHVLREVGNVLADVGLGEAEAVAEQDRLAVLGKRLRRLPGRRVERHHEHREFHRTSSGAIGRFTGRRSRADRSKALVSMRRLWPSAAVACCVGSPRARRLSQLLRFFAHRPAQLAERDVARRIAGQEVDSPRLVRRIALALRPSGCEHDVAMGVVDREHAVGADDARLPGCTPRRATPPAAPRRSPSDRARRRRTRSCPTVASMPPHSGPSALSTERA